MAKQKDLNIDLDDHASLYIRFSNNDKMLFHLADGNFGAKWYPDKNAINKLISVLQKIESQMTNETNLAIQDE